jgi:D-alanyl-D-alanine carboxypeptidase
MQIPKEAVGIEGSSMYLREGEVLTLQELLYGLMLHSGNDAATALAIYCGGTVEGFSQLMNDKAHRLGLTGTHFENPHGLDSPNHYSTARDLAVLAAYAMKNPIFARTVSTKNVRVGERSLQNHNKLLWRVEGADGVKTGYTKAAGRILVSSATRDGRRLICVTINDGNDWADHAVLLEDGFS